MKDTLSRIMLCLAALDLPQDELRRLVNELRSMSWQEINARVSSLRQHSQYPATYEDTFPSWAERSPDQSHGASVAERVERLLKVEAGLSTAQAVEKLASRLSEMGLIEFRDLPTLSRKSFRDWVVRLAQRVPSKEILRHATILRNEHVHSPITDWTLSRPEK
jgi:hypothetical protein